MTTLHSSFPFLYGGPVGSGGLVTGEILRTVLDSTGRLSSLRLQGNPFVGIEANSVSGAQDESATVGQDHARISGLRPQEEHTHLMRVPETEEEYWESILEARRRNDLRRLLRKGVVIEESRDPADVRTVYGFYLDSFKRWGGRPAMVYPLDFYRNLISMGGSETRFLVARFEGRLLGGSFFARWNLKTHYLAGYFDHEARALSPLALIQVDAIRRAIIEKTHIYDFLPSGGHEAVEAFKQGLGGRPTPFWIYERIGALHRVAGRLRR